MSKLLFEKLKSKPLWHGILFTAIIFHFFTWSFPFPSDAEAAKYLQGIRGELPEAGWIVLTRIINSLFSFGYAKFVFVILGLLCVLLVYQILKIIADEYLAIVGALIFSVNSFIFTIWHRVQPDIVIALLLLACIYLYVRFATYWHIEIDKSAHVTTFGIAALAFLMLNIEFNSLYLIPSLVLMVFFVQIRIYSPLHAMVSTIIISCAFAAVQWLIVPHSYPQLLEIIQSTPHPKVALSFFNELGMIYVDGYASPIWHSIYKTLDFLNLDEAPHRIREFFVLLIASAILVGLFLIKMARLLTSRKWGKTDLMVLVYRPHIPLVLTLILAFLSTTASLVVVDKVSPSYLFSQVFILLLLCLSIHAFFLKLTPGEHSMTIMPLWSEMFYKPVAALACMAALVIGLANSIFYVMPYRGSNYPALYDALQRRWEGTNCRRVAYAPPLYVAALATEQHPPAKDIEELYEALNAGNPLEEGCIILPLVAKDGVHGYSQLAKTMHEPIVHLLIKAHYRLIDKVVLPFYQKDPAYPISMTENSNPYEHAHGTLLYGFGGMEEIVIYAPSIK